MKNALFCLYLVFVFSCIQKENESTQSMEDTLTSSTAYIADEVAEVDNTFLIQIGKAGLVEKGMYAGKLYELYDSVFIHKNFPKSELPKNYALYAVYESGEQSPSLSCIVTSFDTIASIHIHDSHYKTAKGIGVGNTLNELNKAYHVAEVYTDKNSRIIIRVEELQQKQNGLSNSLSEGVEFEIGFDAEAAALAGEKGDIDASSIPPESKIISIVL